MKIRTDNYILAKDGKLSISLIVEDAVPLIRTGAIINTSHLAFFAGKIPDSLMDILYLSAAVYAIDRTFNRNKHSLDGWSREFDVTFKLKNSDIFESNRCKWDALLSFLTGDFWTTHFEPLDNRIPYPMIDIPELDCNLGQVNLFSGGMDSLIGAIDYLAVHETPKLCIVSHYDHFMGGPKADQDRLVGCFMTHYPNRFYHLPAVHIHPLVSSETTCRSRSLMFLAIALMVAAYKNVSVVVPENGSVSLNFPLTVSRRAACSTRTTHPLFLFQLREILRSMDIITPIINPYEYKTKGKMVNECADRTYLLSILSNSNSCGKRSQHQFMYDDPEATHCGRCMPCMYRKASLAGHMDTTRYGVTLTTIFNRRPYKMSNDFYAMLSYLKRDLTREDIRRELRIAGLGQLPNFEKYIILVEETREELKNLIRQDGSSVIKAYIGI